VSSTSFSGDQGRSHLSSVSTSSTPRAKPHGGSARIVRLIVIPSSEGFSEREIARKLGTTQRWVLTRLDELRDELERLALPR